MQRKVGSVKTSCFVWAVLLCAGLGTPVPALAQGAYDKYLSAADVEKAAGVAGVHQIARGSVAGAGGDLNFANDAGDVILMVQFADAKSFAGVKAKYGKGAVAGLGEQAIEGGSMPGMPDNLIAFTKGSRCVILTAFGDFATKKMYLTIDQLTSLAKAIAARL